MYTDPETCSRNRYCNWSLRSSLSRTRINNIVSSACLHIVCVCVCVQMALRGVRSSKFRHTFGTAAKRDLCYEGVKISRNAHDGNFCAVSARNLAIVTDSSGGGTFVVVPLNQVRLRSRSRFKRGSNNVIA